jgi:tetratricopeptide (TPR) repeat protein
MNKEIQKNDSRVQWAESIAALRACIGASVVMMRRDRYFFNGEPADIGAGCLEVVFDNSHSFTLCINTDGESARVSGEPLDIIEAFCLDDGSRCEWKEYRLTDHPEWASLAGRVLEGAEAVLWRLEDGTDVVIGWSLLLSGGRSIVYFNCGDESRILVDQLVDESPDEVIEYVSIDELERMSAETAPRPREATQAIPLRQRIMSLRTLILGIGCGLLVLFVVWASWSNPDAETHTIRGASAFYQHRWNDALFHFKRAVEVDPNSADAYDNLGVVYARLGQWPNAIAAYRKAIEIDPDYANAHFNMGLAHCNLEQWPDAIAAYKKAVASSVFFPRAYCNMGYVYCELKQYENAIATYKKAVSLYPEHAAAHFGMGYVYQELEQYADAVAAYKKCISLEPVEELSDEARYAIKKIENRDKPLAK